MSNIVKSTLVKVFGDNLPDDTTSFHTYGNTAVFVVGNHNYVDVEFDEKQKSALNERGLLGSFGWSLA